MTLEKIGEGRWICRLNGLRVGEVFGGCGTYVAERSNQHLGTTKTRNAAAQLLVNAAQRAR